MWLVWLGRRAGQTAARAAGLVQGNYDEVGITLRPVVVVYRPPLFCLRAVRSYSYFSSTAVFSLLGLGGLADVIVTIFFGQHYYTPCSSLHLLLVICRMPTTTSWFSTTTQSVFFRLT